MPEKLHIPRLHFDKINEDDHDWHEILKPEPSSDPPDINLDKASLLKLAKVSSSRYL